MNKSSGTCRLKSYAVCFSFYGQSLYEKSCCNAVGRVWLWGAI